MQTIFKFAAVSKGLLVTLADVLNFVGMDIVIDKLSKSYGFQKAVDDISFQVKTGEILGFLGPNGAGKTTTMKMITGYLSIDAGDVSMNGKSIKEHDMKGRIGYLPEHNPLYEDMPVIDYLEFCAALQQVPKEEMEGQIQKMIKIRSQVASTSGRICVLRITVFCRPSWRMSSLISTI